MIKTTRRLGWLAIAVLAACGSVTKTTPATTSGSPATSAPASSAQPPSPPPAMRMTNDATVALNGCQDIGSTPTALDAFNKGCELKDGQACIELGERYFCGGGVPRDVAKAADYGGRACDLGVAAGCNVAAMSLLAVPAETERARAQHFALHGCDLGDDMSCVDLGIVYLQGVGVPVDVKRALQIFEKYCQRSVMNACANLALLVYMGNGTARDVPRARDLAERSCAAHMDAGCNVLGAIFMDANDAASADRAAQIFGDLCQRSVGEGCDNLGVLYMRGLAGRAPDREHATPAFKRACDLGNAIGCTHYGQVSASP